MFFLETNLYPALLKLPAILSDMGIAYLIYKILKDEKKEKLGVFGTTLFLVNPISWYNSAFWGQTDAIISFFALLSFYLLIKRKLLLAFLALALSFYIKASLLIFVPIFAIVALKQKYKTGEIIKAIFVPLIVIGILTLPFSKDPFGALYEIFTRKVFIQQLQVITANAFNIWAGLTGIHEQPHTLLLGPLSYKVWGWILFGVSLIPTLYIVWKKQDVKSIFTSLAIVAFSSFMLLTNMHERYLYPLFPAFTILVSLDRKLLPYYWGVSGIHLLNLYNFWWAPKIKPLVDIMSAGNRLLPRILGFINFGLYLSLLSRFFRQLKLRKL
jgi:Gpi18-like mannosyltransferase